MKTVLKKLDECIGKTVSGIKVIDNGETISLYFSDESVLVLQPTDHGVEYLSNKIEVRYLFDAYDSLSIGLISREEYLTIINETREREERFTKQKEIEQYKKLKEKYGDLDAT